MAVESKTGKLKAGKGTGPDRAPELVPVASKGYSWAVFSTGRDIKREIRANLQANLTLMVNVSFQTPFLEALRAHQNSFSVMLRWTSRTFKETPWADTEAGIEAEPQKAAAKKEADAKKAEEDWQAKWNGMQEGAEKNTEKEKHEQEIKDAEEKKAGDAKLWADSFFIRSITSRAWIIGVWQVTRKEMAETDFEDTKSSVIKYFSVPQTIENGCDYISKIIPTGTTKKGAAGLSFHMYASDGPSRHEISTVGFDLPGYAFDAIDRRMNLSSIHMLPIKAEIEVSDGEKFPAVSVLNSAALLQIQEARMSIAFLKTQTQKETVSSEEAELNKVKDECLLKGVPFPPTLLRRLDKLEVKVLKTPALWKD